MLCNSSFVSLGTCPLPWERLMGRPMSHGTPPRRNGWEIYHPMGCVPLNITRPIRTAHGTFHGTELVPLDAPRWNSWDIFQPMRCVPWDRTRPMGTAHDTWDVSKHYILHDTSNHLIGVQVSWDVPWDVTWDISGSEKCVSPVLSVYCCVCALCSMYNVLLLYRLNVKNT